MSAAGARILTDLAGNFSHAGSVVAGMTAPPHDARVSTVRLYLLGHSTC